MLLNFTLPKDRFLKLPTWTESLEECQLVLPQLNGQSSYNESETNVIPPSLSPQSMMSTTGGKPKPMIHPNNSLSQGYSKLLSSELLSYLYNKSKTAKKENKENEFYHRLLSVNKFNENSFCLLTKQMLKPIQLWRNISTVPYKILDAPNIIDDFYLNLLDWSTMNILAVGLGQDLYLWSSLNNQVKCKLAAIEEESIIDFWTSVSWNFNGIHLALGRNLGKLEIWDVERGKIIQKIHGAHTDRIGSLAWNESMLSTGSKDRSIKNFDLRSSLTKSSKGRKKTNPTFVLEAHKHEVCGIKWSANGKFLCSGGNDNLLFIWDTRKQGHLATDYLHCFTQHTAAIKAIDWCPSKSNWLATGGGTLDKQLILWDISIGQLLSKVDTGSQICNLFWSRNQGDFELITSQGFTKNQLIFWKYGHLFPPYTESFHTKFNSSSAYSQSKENFKETHDNGVIFSSEGKQFIPLVHFSGHSQRAIHMAHDPNNNERIVTGAGDETLRFWNVFSKSKSHNDIVPNLAHTRNLV